MFPLFPEAVLRRQRRIVQVWRVIRRHCHGLRSAVATRTKVADNSSGLRWRSSPTPRPGRSAAIAGERQRADALRERLDAAQTELAEQRTAAEQATPKPRRRTRRSIRTAGRRCAAGEGASAAHPGCVAGRIARPSRASISAGFCRSGLESDGAVLFQGPGPTSPSPTIVQATHPAKIHKRVGTQSDEATASDVRSVDPPRCPIGGQPRRPTRNASPPSSPSGGSEAPRPVRHIVLKDDR